MAGEAQNLPKRRPFEPNTGWDVLTILDSIMMSHTQYKTLSLDALFGAREMEISFAGAAIPT